MIYFLSLFLVLNLRVTVLLREADELDFVIGVKTDLLRLSVPASQVSGKYKPVPEGCCKLLQRHYY